MNAEQSDQAEIPLLLVEDDDIDATLLERAFKKKQLAVAIHRAVDGEEALNLLRAEEAAPHVRPAIVLLDLNLPRMTGLEFLSEMRTNTAFSHLPVFVFSTSSNPQEIRAAYDMNVAAYMVKPISSGQLDAVADLLTIWLQLTRLPD